MASLVNCAKLDAPRGVLPRNFKIKVTKAWREKDEQETYGNKDMWWIEAEGVFEE